MDYVDLRRGNRTPAVGVLQKLLNRTGERLVVDGEFGAKTEAAVIRFQRQHRLAPDGIVGQQTWPRIAAGAGLRIVDFIDITDPDLDKMEASDIAKAGGHPLVMGGVCNGVDQAVRMILVAAPARSVFLLRFHGHGQAGMAGMGMGRDSFGWGERSDVDWANLNKMRSVLARLAPIFGPYGNVQFMHCETGSGPRGQATLKMVAEATGVPATAGVHLQYGGGTDTFKFEGPTVTAIPGGGSLRSWCMARPEFAGMSMA
ncbi:MAG TPA: peptidoglycan-binding domain-containing protein [Terracidiphilus sp.]